MERHNAYLEVEAEFGVHYLWIKCEGCDFTATLHGEPHPLEALEVWQQWHQAHPDHGR